MIENVYKTIIENNLIESKDKIILGISGGPDSICMLDILNKISKNEKYKLEFEIIVAHINHMIREEADSDEKFVEEFCKNNNIKFYSKKINVKQIAIENKKGLEETGRKVRYEFFDELLKETNSNKISIAHNKNDKIETIIMNTLRGSGIQGLRGIETKKDNIYIRPLINCERKEIEKYCEENNLNPRIDKTNYENDYTRNKIRNIVIPYIQKEFNPNIITTLNRLSDVIKQEDDYLKEEVEKSINDILVYKRKNEIVLELKKFNTLNKAIRTRIIRVAIAQLFGSNQNIEKVHIDDIIKLCENNIGNKYLTPNKNTKVLLKNHKIFIIKKINNP